MNKKEEQNKKKKYWGVKAFFYTTAFLMLFAANGRYVYASDIGENAATWLLDQIFWVGLVGVVVGVIFLVVKRAYIGAITLTIGGSLVLVIVKNPSILVNLGSTFAKILGLS